MGHFNGSARVIQSGGALQVPLETDSSKSGFGCVWGSDWCAGTWNDSVTSGESCYIPKEHLESPPSQYDTSMDVYILELWTVGFSVKRWGRQWKDSKVRLKTDNTQVAP